MSYRHSVKEAAADIKIPSICQLGTSSYLAASSLSWTVVGFESMTPDMMPIEPSPSSPSEAAPQDEASLLNEIERVTGIPAIEWAAMHIPVLCATAPVDLTGRLSHREGARIIGSTDLAARLNLNPRLPFGVQLQMKGVLNAHQARAVDADLLDRSSLFATFRSELPAFEVWAIIDACQRSGLIKEVFDRQCLNGLCFTTIGSEHMTALCHQLARETSNQIALTSLNGTVLSHL